MSYTNSVEAKFYKDDIGPIKFFQKASIGHRRRNHDEGNSAPRIEEHVSHLSIQVARKRLSQ